MKLIYSDANSLAYEKQGVRYSLMYHGGRVLVTEMKDGKVDEYMLDIDDAIACLRSGPEADYAVKFLRKLKRKIAKAQLRISLLIILKLSAHMVISAIVGGLAVFLYFTFKG